VRWLRELFELPPEFAGVLVTGATMANFTGLIAARSWWAERCGFDADEAGLAGAPPPVILSSGYIHPSAMQAISMAGLGRGNVRRLARDSVGRLDVDALADALATSGPAIVIANAGEVNAGDFDPIADLADLAERHGAWLHVDGAFGLFAALSPRTRHLTAGVERADSIAADGHKWLNVPYESGFALVREPERLGRAFGMPGAAYLPGPQDPGGGYGLYGPESSRRSRALPIWATLAAYGRDGHRAMVERHLDLAQRLTRLITAAPDLELLADTQLCVVCFRAAPPGVAKEDLDDLNRRLGAALLADGRVFAGTTVYGGVVALRPAIVNWRTTGSDIDAFVDVVRELTARLA